MNSYNYECQGCHRPGCNLIRSDHQLEYSKVTEGVVCTFKDKCYRQDCTFVHQALQQKRCNYAQSCTAVHCPYLHQECRIFCSNPLTCNGSNCIKIHQRNRVANVTGNEKSCVPKYKGAGIIPIYVRNNQIHLILTIENRDHKSWQGGGEKVHFFGGEREHKDVDSLQTAAREMYEESAYLIDTITLMKTNKAIQSFWLEAGHYVLYLLPVTDNMESQNLLSLPQLYENTPYKKKHEPWRQLHVVSVSLDDLKSAASTKTELLFNWNLLKEGKEHSAKNASQLQDPVHKVPLSDFLQRVASDKNIMNCITEIFHDNSNDANSQ